MLHAANPMCCYSDNNTSDVANVNVANMLRYNTIYSSHGTPVYTGISYLSHVYLVDTLTVVRTVQSGVRHTTAAPRCAAFLDVANQSTHLSALPVTTRLPKA